MYGQIPISVRASVDLPEPDGPMIAVTCPAGNAMSMRLMIGSARLGAVAATPCRLISPTGVSIRCPASRSG